MKGAIITLLNNSLGAQGFSDVRVVELSDDFETAIVMHNDGISGVVKSETLLPQEEYNEQNKTTHNTGANVAEVERVRRERVSNPDW